MRYILTIALVITLFQTGCMDDLHDYKECKRIESARCELRKNCQQSGDATFRKNFKKFDYDTCLTYAREHCRTRKIGWDDSEWSAGDISNCTSAILALYPEHCKYLSKAEDETEWPIMNDACIFIEEREEPDPIIPDGGTET